MTKHEPTSNEGAKSSIWGGRFASGPSQLMQDINASISYDQRLYRQDIAGSKAHATMLAACGIITAADCEAIHTGLAQIASEIEQGSASVKLSCGTVGHGYVKGREKTMALRIALCDALLQTADANKVDAKILQPLIDAKLTCDQEITDKAAATKVDFFTLVRGE